MSIVFDFAAIAASGKSAPEEPAVKCAACEDGGWECYGLGYGDPHFRTCPECGNPEDLPCP